MRSLTLLLTAPLGVLLLSGCVSTAVGIVKAPFQVAGQVVDWTTTSQSESDRNYGRKIREQEEAEGRRQREAEREARRACERSGARDC